MESYKIYIDSAAWVCEANLVGSSRIYRYLIENGHNIISDPAEADYIIINSCGFATTLADKSVNLFNRFCSIKKEKTKIIMYGCLVKIGEDLIKSLDVFPIDFDETEKFDEIFYKKIKFIDVKPYCDHETKKKLLVGKNPFQRSKTLPFLLSSLMFPFSKKVRTNHNKIVDSFTYQNNILVEISKGCTGNCSYCVIKKARGDVKSRKISEIISDIEKLYDPSKNLFLVADDCGCYGIDIGTNLIELLYEINKILPDLSIELNYLNPYWLDRYPEKYIKVFNDIKIGFACIPVQSGSNKILDLMNRNYDINKIIKVVTKIKQKSPKTITYTHFIIGYPYENTVDFIKTLICATHFDFPQGFGYSASKDSTKQNNKSNFTISTRIALYWFVINFIIAYKLLKYPND